MGVDTFMKILWDYISGRTRTSLTMSQVVIFMTVAMLGIHTALLLMFLFFNIYFMVGVNVASLILYIVCFIFIRIGKNPYIVFNLCYAEVILHAFLAVVMVGTSYGFTLYMLSMTPLAYYAAYSFNSDKQSVNPMTYVIISCIAYIIVRYIAAVHEPVYVMGGKEVDLVMYSINYFIVVATIVAFMSTFLIQIRTLEEQMLNKNKRLEVLSTHDTLTGLFNRRCIHDRYIKALKNNECYSIILGDIDDFKKVNDTYGHSCGDNVLKGVADVFKTSVRRDDVVCRWGGEEILVMLPYGDKDDAQRIAGRISESIRNLVIKGTEDEDVKVTMTFGVSDSNEASDIKDVTRIADTRLYYGKTHGKNCIIAEDGLE